MFRPAQESKWHLLTNCSQTDCETCCLRKQLQAYVLDIQLLLPSPCVPWQSVACTCYEHGWQGITPEMRNQACLGNADAMEMCCAIMPNSCGPNHLWAHGASWCTLIVIDNPWAAQLANSMHTVWQIIQGLKIGNKKDEWCLCHQALIWTWD